MVVFGEFNQLEAVVEILCYLVWSVTQCGNIGYVVMTFGSKWRPNTDC